MSKDQSISETTRMEGGSWSAVLMDLLTVVPVVTDHKVLVMGVICDMLC